MIIAMTGYKGAGKSLAAAYLWKQYGFMQYAFADPMKAAMHAVFGWTDEHLHGKLKEVEDPRYSVSPRFALQTFGTEWGQHLLSEHKPFKQNVGRKLWVKIFIERFYDPDFDWVISDLRFPHEMLGLWTIDTPVY